MRSQSLNIVALLSYSTVSPDTRCGWVGKIVFEPLGVKRYEIKVLLDDRGGETDDARDDIDVIELGS